MIVEWAQSAQQDAARILNYCKREFGLAVADRLRRLLADYNRLLVLNPQLRALEPMLRELPGEYRSVVVHKHVKLIYLLEVEKLYVLIVWDTRYNPSRVIDNLHRGLDSFPNLVSEE